MNRFPTARLEFAGRALTFGPIPRVVGTLSSPAWHVALADAKEPPDIVEVRLDLIGQPAGWLKRCRAIEASGRPILVTLRLASEGGKWNRSDKARSPFLARALDHVSAVDVELKSDIAAAISRRAARLGKICIVSFHDFDRTPPIGELVTIVERAQQMGSIAKVATFVRKRSDLATLHALLRQRWSVPLCVIGMGALAEGTRVSFPALGSCLTYGYLDKPAAPGQLPAARLVRRLRALLPAYDSDYRARQRTQATH